jgi:NADH:ubiquinone reductase (H+-translocating)
MKAEQNKASVVVVGAGFSGLEAVRALFDTNVDVTLVDSKNHHCFQPLLYQVATAALSPADVAWPIRSILAGQRNVTVLMSEVKAVDPVARTVTTADDLLLHFDYLILATGVTSSYFNHPEWARYAPGLKTIEDATRIRARILLSFERAERSDRMTADLTRSLTFVVVGGGPTGVELAGSIADIAHHALAGDFRNINPKDAKIILIEAGQRILATFPEELSAYARGSLVDMGVEVITGAAVTDCDANGVSISDGRRIESSCVLWAAGVKASPAASWLGIEADRAGRIKVDEHLRVQGFGSIFAVGDIAAANSGGKPVPGLAPAAKQMGRYAGLFIAGDVLHRSTKVRPFVYYHQGDLATIGRKSAVVSLHRLRLKGFLGWLFWGIAHIYFLIGVRNRAVVAVNWIWEYLTFQRGARLIS